MAQQTCEHCQYFREGYWCSNSKSPNFRYSTPEGISVAPRATCDQFYPRGKKAPLALRLAVGLLRGVNEKLSK